MQTGSASTRTKYILCLAQDSLWLSLFGVFSPQIRAPITSVEEASGLWFPTCYIDPVFPETSDKRMHLLSVS